MSRRPARCAGSRPERVGADEPAGGEALHPNLHAIDRRERARGQRGLGSDREDLIRIMGREDDRKSARRESGDFAEHQRLVAEIETRRRLAHHEDGAVLRQRSSDQHELALTAG